METWTGAFPQLLAAYEHKERFYGIWDATTRLQAEAALDEWIATIPKGQKEVWSDLVRAVGNGGTIIDAKRFCGATPDWWRKINLLSGSCFNGGRNLLGNFSINFFNGRSSKTP